MKSVNLILYLRHLYLSEWKWNPTYLFELECSLGESNIVGEIEDSVEMDPFRAAWVGNDNWCVH